MALLANLQEVKQDQIEQIWRGLVNYANGDNSREDFQNLVIESFKRMGMEDAAHVLQECGDLKSGTSLDELEDKYRGSVRDALRWVISPISFSNTELEDTFTAMNLATDAARFVSTHATDVVVEWNPGLVHDLESETLTVYLHRVFMRVGSVVTGMCWFIYDQIQRHNLDGEPVTKVFPFGICERKGCGRFFIVQRAGRGRFCSDNCRAAVAKQKMSREDKALAMKKYRAAKTAQAERAQRARQRAKKSSHRISSGREKAHGHL